LGGGGVWDISKRVAIDETNPETRPTVNDGEIGLRCCRLDRWEELDAVSDDGVSNGNYMYHIQPVFQNASVSFEDIALLYD
jgi:hypothetical protein